MNQTSPEISVNTAAQQSPISNLFGTDGIRARVGSFPCTEKDLAQLGYAIGFWALQKYGSNPRLLIGHDSRESAQFMIDALSAGLLQHPIFLCNAGILPTPALIKIATLDESVDGAIIITASHNPYYDNGIKIIDRASGKLNTNDEELITQFFEYQTVTAHTPKGRFFAYLDGDIAYQQEIAHYFESHFLNGKKIVLDCANGALSKLAPRVFTEFGATVHALNTTPNGRNINEACGATHTEKLQKSVVELQADIGFAFDGDGDRVVVVNKQGVIKDGDDILALLLDHPVYKNSSPIIATVMSNGGFEHFVEQKQKSVIRTPVGDKWVSTELKNRNLLLGGEQSGHILLADFLHSSDGIFAALRVCEAAQLNNNWELKTFDHLAQTLINVPVSIKKDLQAPDLQAIIQSIKEQLSTGTLLTRYSGTENLLRIMVQHKDQETANKLCLQLANQLKQALG